MFKLPARISTWLYRLCMNVLKAGPIPKHISFIMDGNRRYAKKHDITEYEGYDSGKKVIENILQWCLCLGIREITLYIFSMYNYKRNTDEIYSVFVIVKNILTNDSYIMKHGIRYRILGDISLLPPHMRTVCAKALLKWQHNNNLIVNLALSYASRYEITNSVKCIIEGVEKQLITVEDINEQLITDCLYTNECSDLDMIVRSSGVTHLSDFLTWQSSTACLLVIEPLWPEYSVWHFIRNILRYQRYHRTIQALRNEMSLLEPEPLHSNDRVEKFLSRFREFHQGQLEYWAAV